MVLDREKLKELVLYICHRCADTPEMLGKTKLNKILWFSDALRYINTGKSITGETYVKHQYGPVSKNILGVFEELQREGRLDIRLAQYYGHQKYEYRALAEPKLDGFSAGEISLVEGVARQVCEDYTAKSISDLTHTDIWEIAVMGEEIPLGALLVFQLGEIDEQDTEWARGVLETAYARLGHSSI